MRLASLQMCHVKNALINLVLFALIRNFAPVMTSIRKTNIVLALTALTLAVLCVLSIVK